MQKKIHPKYNEIIASCSCGNIIKTSSTINHNLTLEVCNECHPFYTGKQRIVDTCGRVTRFNQRLNFLQKIKT